MCVITSWKAEAPFAICMGLKFSWQVEKEVRTNSEGFSSDSSRSSEQVEEYIERRKRERSNNHGIIRESKSQWQSDGRRHCQSSLFLSYIPVLDYYIFPFRCVCVCVDFSLIHLFFFLPPLLGEGDFFFLSFPPHCRQLRRNKRRRWITLGGWLLPKWFLIRPPPPRTTTSLLFRSHQHLFFSSS
jgi:hypothetical protein